jgi:carboxyl-terminal processing protease
MLHRGKAVVFFCSLIIVLYAVSAAFYGKVVAKDEAYKELSVFMDALKKINEDYVEAPDMSKVQEGAFRGLIEALDPYSSFLSKEEIQRLEKRKAAGNAGVGLVLSKKADVVYVVTVYRGSPADAAGLRAGDYLMMVDNTSVEDKSILEVESLLRGAPDSTVKVTVFRSARTKPAEYTLTRKADLDVPVVAQMQDGGVGVLDVSALAGSTLDQVRVKLKTIISAGAQKLILDLRDCADGPITDGATLANFFLREGVITYSQNKEGQKVQQIEADPKVFITDMPMVVLINGSTAGAAEIAAGALKDLKRATIVGDKSFGLGSSQKQIMLKSGAALILSTAKYYTPGGKMIQDDLSRNAGIKPDVQSPDEERRQDLLVDAYYDEQQDDVAKYKQLLDSINKEQMDKALEVLSRMPVPLKKAA